MKKKAKKSKALHTKQKADEESAFGIPATRRNQVLACMIIFCVAVGVYWNTLGNEFVYDDKEIIVNNGVIKDARNTLKIFSTAYWPGIGGENNGLYRPLVILSYALNYRFSSLYPFSYHFVNIILHGLNCVLLYFFCLAILKNNSTSLFASLLFATHPVHTEAVASIVGRAELQAYFFFFLSLLFYIYKEKSKYKWSFYGASLLSFFLALLSKEHTVTLIGVIIVYDFVFIRNLNFGDYLKNIKPQIVYYIGCVAVLVLYLLMRAKALGDLFVAEIPFEVNPLVDASIYNRLLTSIKLLFKYLSLLVYPRYLTVDYSYNQLPVSQSLFELETFFSAIVLGILLVGAFVFYKKSRAVFFFILFFVLTYSIISNSFILIGTIMNERLIYLPSTSFCVLLVILTHRIFKGKDSKSTVNNLFATCSMTLILSGMYSYKTIKRNTVWRNDYALFTDASILSPKSAKVFFNLGKVYQDRKQNEKAVDSYNKSINIYPEYALPYNNLGNIRSEEGSIDDAISYYNKAIQFNPRYALAYYNRGRAYRKKGLIDEAISDYNEAIRFNPEYVEAYINRGFAYSKKNLMDEAISDYNKAIKLDPENAAAYYNRAIMYEKKGHTSDAITDYDMAIRFKPEYVEAYINRGIAYSKKGFLDEAISDYNKAIQLEADNASAYNNRGNVYDKKRLLDQAISDYSRAIQLNPGYVEAYYNRGVVYYKKGNKSLAVKDFKESAKMGLGLAKENLRKLTGNSHYD